MFGRSVHARAGERRSLPGDDLLTDPIGSLTHAVTIRRPRHDVWRWLVQMGAGRAGWYSYDFVDNGGHPSAERILPEFQSVAVGTVLPAVPGATDGFFVIRYEPERTLVLGWLPVRNGAPLVTWTFVLEEQEPDCTRLIVRARAGDQYRLFGFPKWLVKLIVPWGHFVMQRRQLLGIVRRAEAHG